MSDSPVSAGDNESVSVEGPCMPHSRKWSVWIDGKRRGEVFGENLTQATDTARQAFRVRGAATLQVRPRYPRAGDGLVDKRDPALGLSSKEDARVVRVALEVLGWTRQQLQLKTSRITQMDVNHFLQGRSSGAVKQEIWSALRAAGCEPEEISQLIHKTTPS